jgi:hypothetical protein
VRALTVITIIVLFAACDQPASSVPQDPSFATDVLPILNASCAGCHSGSAPSGDYAVTTYSGVVSGGTDSIPNVIPGAADSSRLYQRLIGAVLPQMPLGGTPLDTIRLYTIRNWIDRGARDN